MQPIEEALGVSRSLGSKVGSGVKSFLMFLNEAIFLSTYRAGKEHWENRQAMKGRVNESGFQITLKAEFQFGMGRFNITKNLPLVLSFGYNKDTRRVLIRGGRRIETMDGGSAFSGGVKVELRKYQRISTPGKAGAVQIEGISWYPPSVPMVSLTADSTPIYRSIGLVFGVNVADLVPGLYFVNTVNHFTEKDYFVRSIRMPGIPGWIRNASGRLGQVMNFQTATRVPVACHAIF